jgi:glucosamine-6-phosphate deaminase
VTPGAVQERTVDALQVRVFRDAEALARTAAADAAATLRAAIGTRGNANAMFASGNSQLRFLRALARVDGVDWARVVGFHMDEYVGIRNDHPASFHRYMQEQVARPLRLGDFHYLDGGTDPVEEAAQYAALLRQFPIDVCCLGIGENGHLAFNDPPVAEFDDPLDVKVVTLDDACRRQQVGEGHFATIDDVPARAITVTIPALLRAKCALAIVPEGRKREPVRRALTERISPACPASILRRSTNATLYLDRDSSSLLDMHE